MQPHAQVISTSARRITLPSWKRLIYLLIIIVLSAMLLGSSVVLPSDQTEKVRLYTRNIEFDYVAWTLNALSTKFKQLALGSLAYIPDEQRRQLFLDYIDLIEQIQKSESELYSRFADPDVTDPQAATSEVRAQLQNLYNRQSRQAPIAEAILQDQISKTAASLGLSLGGQPLPPVLYQNTPLPLALIVSPRNTIRQDENISLIPELSIDQRAALEDQVDDKLDVSSLVVGIGGVGVYPTMVMQTSDVNWLAEVVAHEWVHNFLTLRPLGINYLTSPELRIMNETAASIAGKEIGRVMMEANYPELLPRLPEPAQSQSASPQPTEPAGPLPFDFRAEMRETRVNTDRLLAEGKIDEAEQYMESRRAFFWENGYRIRKLNQAYFAFYGAYADEPGGAAGEDPVGAAVRELRAQSDSLADFLNRISWMSSYEQLQRAVGDDS